MSITEQQLQRIMPNARRQAGVFVSALNAAMANRQIDTPKRQAAFLAQVGHESGQLQYVRELGGDQYLSKYDTGTLAARLGNTPEADGDGQRYRGRGLIQITGHNNYLRCSLALFGDNIPPLGWAGIAVILASGVAATVLRSRALPNTPAEEH